MIDLAKCANIDDENFVIKLGSINQIICNKWDDGGALVGIDYCEDSQDERSTNRKRLVDLASRIATRIEYGE